MNYCHSFHAGNFADVVKHALLLAILEKLRRKEAAFLVLDTHAGPGATALDGAEASRTGEWRGGIGRLLADPPEVLRPYVAAVTREAARYPGSPLLVRAALRGQDRLVACELHPADVAALRANLAGDRRCAVHHRDGYAAIRALLPPRGIRRGLVLIDPPFEAPDEWETLAAAIAAARERFPAGIVAAWYPIKGRAAARGLGDTLVAAGLRDLVAYEFLLRPPLDATRLNGCGVLVANNPFGLEQDAAALLAGLGACLGDRDAPPPTWRIERLAAE